MMKNNICIICLLFYSISIYSQSLLPSDNDGKIEKIPELISKIDSNHFSSTCCPVNFYDSYIPSVYIGEYFAKEIEVIVHPKFNIFTTIVKKGHKHSITLEDMIIIKGLYNEWWEHKKYNPNYHRSALKGSKYKWKRCPIPHDIYKYRMYLKYTKDIKDISKNR